MDVSILSGLLAPLATLSGVGPALAERMARAVGGPTVLDLLFHLPDTYIDRSTRMSLSRVDPGGVATAMVTVIRHEAPMTPRQPWRVVVGDETGFAELTFFGRPGQAPPALARMSPGTRLLVSGKADLFNGRLCFPHPDHILAPDAALPAFEPVWRLAGGLAGWRLRRAMEAALDRLPDLPEWQDPALLRRESWPSFAQALLQLQAPATRPGLAPRLRLAYDEAFARQLAFARSRRRGRALEGRSIAAPGRYRGVAMARFGHPLTPSQHHALAEIDADLAARHRMLRLLQGDVGSGKTLVALLAMLNVAEAGYQAALMAPTDVLARQHARVFRALSPVAVELFSGSITAAERRRVLAGLEQGSVRLVVGTHALFQAGVAFRDLAFAVVDEQHRFGVAQRLTLSGKGVLTDLLVMTATPIPRTLLLAQWGEMDVSRLTGKPAGRLPIRTTIHPHSALPGVVEAIDRALAADSRVFWVCPLVKQSERADIAAAEARFAFFRARFGARVGLMHGRQDPALRDQALAAFASGRTSLLVATTVVEVGVDVPTANVMVIDQAERFGLAQLHQLRGRVGRGDGHSFCLLLHDDTLTAAARGRLALLRDTEDGYEIAEEDFRLRGAGDLLGTAQSGSGLGRLQHPEQQGRLEELARRDAECLLTLDPDLASERGRACRLLLRLFGRERPAETLAAG